MKAIMTIGAPASGKSTWARKFIEDKDYAIIERDKVRLRIQQRDGVVDANATEVCWPKWNFKLENEVTDMVRADIVRAAGMGMNIIISDTNLNRKHRDDLVGFLQYHGYVVSFKLFPIEYAEAVKRDLKRTHPVGAQVIAKMIQQFDDQFNPPVFKPESRFKAIMVDIDGTLAHMNGRGPFEWHRVGEDAVDPVVRDLITREAASDVNIILMSGRDSICRKDTEKWLEENGVPYDCLYMRPENDFRPDTEVKREMYFQHVHGEYDVMYVIDDRPIVCRMWRQMGFKVFQVGNPPHRVLMNILR